MTAIKLPRQEYLHKIFLYDDETGYLYRKIGVQGCSKITNKVGSPHRGGYLNVAIDYKKYLVHRIIWKMVYGTDPNFIDHISGVKEDNRIENLRSVTRQENARNIKIPKNNTSGTIGVTWNKAKNKWQAQIKVNQKNINLGSFTNINDAIAARKVAEIKYGFHKNHGQR